MGGDDREAIIRAIHSYRPGAPISLMDVRIACGMDGHSIKHIPKNELASIVRSVCTVEHGKQGIHDYRIYRWGQGCGCDNRGYDPPSRTPVSHTCMLELSPSHPLYTEPDSQASYETV